MPETRPSEYQNRDPLNNLATRSVPVRIVLLEDSDSDVELIRRELARSDINFQLRTATTRAQFETAMRSCPDVVLSDYRLPELSGEDALDICKTLCPGTPFILLSGHLKEEFVIRALQQGADDFIVKDRLARLGPAVQKAIADRAERKRLSETESALAGTEERFQTLFSAAPIGLAVLGRNGEFQQVNSALERLFGFAARGWVGKRLFELMSTEARDRFELLVQHLSNTGNREFHLEEQFINKDGGKLWVQISVSRLPSDINDSSLILTFTDVTREKQATRFEALLGKLDRSLSAANNFQQAGAAILETVTELIHCSGAWLFFATKGRNPQKVTGLMKNNSQVAASDLSINAQDWNQIQAALTNLDGTGTSVLGRFLPTGEGNSLLWAPVQVGSEVKGFLAVRGVPSEDEPQKVYDLARIAAECSEALVRIEVTEELKESENRYRTVCESVPIGIFEADLSGNWTYTNARLRQIVQEEGTTFAGQSWFSRIHSLDRCPVEESWQKAVQAGSPWRCECRLLNREGEVRWVRAFATSRTHRDEPLGRFIGAVEDITERRKAESVLHELANIVNNASDSIIGLSPDGVITNWNRGAERTYGYTAEEVASKPVSILIPPERTAEHPLVLLRDENEIQDFETVGVRKDGKRINVSLTVSAVRDSKGELIGASAITRDITERKRLEQEVLDAVTNEQRRIGHDMHDGLGQFLTGLAFRAKMLADSLQEKQLEETIEAAQLVDLLNSATSQTRALARGLDPIAVEAQEIASALTQLADQTELLMRVKCKTILPAERVNIFAFASLHLYRIAQESITNAVKHGNAKSIEIKLESNSEGVVLEVKDNGCGFNPDKVRASGIGLRILQYRARSIGGVLTLTSAPGRGATVRCFVPSNQLLRDPNQSIVTNGLST